MKNPTLVGFVLFSIFTLPGAYCLLWPIPRELQTGSTAIKLASGFNIKPNFANPPQDLRDAIKRTSDYLHNDKLERLVLGGGRVDRRAVEGAKILSSLSLSLAEGSVVEAIAVEAVEEIGTRREEYALTVPDDSSAATLVANSTLGLLRGLTTFEQLWYTDGDRIYTLNTPVHIVDRPAFPYRGFMLDTARSFFPLADIERTLNAMSWVKMSTFHWHITDSQSFPLEVAEFPELAAKGAYSSKEVYTAADVQHIVQYAAERGIDVLMEIDTPGHTTSIAASHPLHIVCRGASPWYDYAAEPPVGQLRVTSNSTINFTKTLISSVAKTMTSILFSTGGDEINTLCFSQDSVTQADLRESGQTIDQALDTFTQAIHGALHDISKTAVVWQEMVLDHPLTLRNDTIVLVWESPDDVSAVLNKGFRIVHAPSDYFYLDCGAGEFLGNNIDVNSWCDPFKTWQKAYSFDPLANVPTEHASLVLGGEQLLWTEQSGPENLDSIVWPRAAASAETMWTGAILPDGNARNVSFALPRLNELRFRMVQRGVRAIQLQPKYCVLRPGVCDADGYH